MSGPVYLQRAHFTVSQDKRYFQPDALTRMIGQESAQWRHAALKELLDNALDAAESVYPATMPVIDIRFAETGDGLLLTVLDNGPGIAPDKIPQIADFAANSSTKLFYRAPLRGAMGNAIKTLLGMPVALGKACGTLEIESRGQRQKVTARLTVTGAKTDIEVAGAAESGATRITALIPGDPSRYDWNPGFWATAYSLFNPHAQLQIRKIGVNFSENLEMTDGKLAVCDFSDLSFAPTVAFPDPWRKFLPTDPTPAHWYSAAEFQTLVSAKAEIDPDQPLGAFVQEFKGLSRVWRKALEGLPVKTIGELAMVPDQVEALHRRLLALATAPRPEVLGRVGKDHFRRRFDEQFTVVKDTKGQDRFWYKKQAGIDGDRPYIIEVAIAETEHPGDVFYGLNYSVPFDDPLSTTRLIYDGGIEPVSATGLTGLLRECGAASGARFGRGIHTAVAVHLVMPTLPSLDMGKTRLAITPALAASVAETVASAAKVLHREAVDWRKQRQRQQARLLDGVQAQRKEQERIERERLAEQERDARAQQRQQRREQREQEAEQRRLRGELPTKRDVLFDLFGPTYISSTENETIRISARDFFYDIRPLFLSAAVRASTNRDGTANTDLDFGYFSEKLAEYRRDVREMPLIDYKARGTLFESHSGREIPVGDRELRNYRLPAHEYQGILFIEKEGVFQTLKDTGGIEFLRRLDLMVLSASGFSTEAARRILVTAQQEHGYQIFCWHDADPAGYSIARTLAEPTERMPDHHLDVIDIGLCLEEGLAMGLQTETFTRKKAIPANLKLTDTERELFSGECWELSKSPARFEWRNCQRIEINAIKPRDRVGYLERKISEALRRPAGVGTGEDEADSLPYRPAPEVMQDYATTLLSRSIAAQIQAALERTIDLSRIAADAQSALEPLTLDSDALQAAVAADSQRPWREIVKQAAHEVWNQQTDLMEQIDQSVVRVLRQALAQLPTND